MRATGPELSTDALFELLADRRQRLILHALAESETAVPVEDLVDEVAAAADVGQTREQTAILLQCSQFPKLEDEGVIDWNREADKVAPGPEFGAVAPVLELLADHVALLPTGLLPQGNRSNDRGS